MPDDEIGLIESADVEKLSPAEQARALFEGTRALYEFATTRVRPVIMGQLAKSDYEQAIAGTYYRMLLLLRGLCRLDNPCHFQIANALARTVFELLLDLKALIANHSQAASFLAFTDVSRFHKARQLAEFLNGNPSVDRAPHEQALQFAGDPQREQRIEQVCIQHWGTDRRGKPNWPDHWSRQSIAERARKAGTEYEEIYRSQFFLQNYYVHAGGAGIDNLSRNALICAFGTAHCLIQQLFAEATMIISDEFHLFQADAELRDKLKRVAAASGFYAVRQVLEQEQASPNQTSHSS